MQWNRFYGEFPKKKQKQTPEKLHMHKYWTLFGNRKDYHLSIGTRRWQNNCGIEQFYAVEQFIFSCYHKSYNDKRTFWSPGEVATVQPQSTVLLIPSTCPDYMDALLTKLGGGGRGKHQKQHKCSTSIPSYHSCYKHVQTKIWLELIEWQLVGEYATPIVCNQNQ